MSIKEQIAEKMRAAGYDFWTAMEEAGRVIREFNVSGEKQAEYHILAAGPGLKRIVDIFVIARKVS